MIKTISSQQYRNETIIEAKTAAENYVVTVSPTFDVGGSLFRVVLDGHHGYEAAMRAGVEPEYVVADRQINDSVALLMRGEIEDFLEINYVDTAYYDIATGAEIW